MLYELYSLYIQLEKTKTQLDFGVTTKSVNNRSELTLGSTVT
jgi:hypothetical protein